MKGQPSILRKLCVVKRYQATRVLRSCVGLGRLDGGEWEHFPVSATKDAARNAVFDRLNPTHGCVIFGGQAGSPCQNAYGKPSTASSAISASTWSCLDNGCPGAFVPKLPEFFALGTAAEGQKAESHNSAYRYGNRSRRCGSLSRAVLSSAPVP